MFNVHIQKSWSSFPSALVDEYSSLLGEMLSNKRGNRLEEFSKAAGLCSGGQILFTTVLMGEVRGFSKI